MINAPDNLLLPPDVLSLLTELQDLSAFITSVVAQGNANLLQSVARLEKAREHTSARLTNLVATTHGRLLRAAANINKLPGAVKAADEKVDTLLHSTIKCRDRLPGAQNILRTNLKKWQSLTESEELLLLIKTFLKEVQKIEEMNAGLIEAEDAELAQALKFTRIADLISEQETRDALSRVVVLQGKYAQILRHLSSIEDLAMEAFQLALASPKVDEIKLRSAIARLACVNALPKAFTTASVILRESVQTSLSSASSLPVPLHVFRTALQRASMMMAIADDTSRARDCLKSRLDCRLELWRLVSTDFVSWIRKRSEMLSNDLSNFIKLSTDVHSSQTILKRLSYDVPNHKEDEVSNLTRVLWPAENKCLDDLFQNIRGTLAILFPRVAILSIGRSFEEMKYELKRERPLVSQNPTRADVVKFASQLNAHLPLIARESSSTTAFRRLMSDAIECFVLCLVSALSEEEFEMTHHLNFELGITAVTATHKARAVVELLLHSFLTQLKDADPILTKYAHDQLMHSIEKWSNSLFGFLSSAVDVLCSLASDAEEDALQILETFHTALGEIADVYFRMLWPIEEFAKRIVHVQTRAIRYFLMVFARSPFGREATPQTLEQLLKSASALLTCAVPKGTNVEEPEWSALQDFSRVMLKDESILSNSCDSLGESSWAMPVSVASILTWDYLAYLLLLRVCETMPELPSCDLTSIGCVVSSFLDAECDVSGNDELARVTRACAEANLADLSASQDYFTKRAAEILQRYLTN